jgi:3-oxoacyl-(acyl-carrier-protein) synthase/SAM-dependent methyltransferase/acyl carrier protein
LRLAQEQAAGNDLPERRSDLDGVDELARRLLWAQLIAAGFPAGGKTNFAAIKTRLGLKDTYERWLAESLSVLVKRGFVEHEGESYSAIEGAVLQAEAVWREWEDRKDEWLTRPSAAPYAILLETTLRALPAILKGERRATDVMFPNSSLALVEGIYKNNPVVDYFNAAVADVVTSFVDERVRQDPSARIRIFEIGAGTGGTSAGVLARLKPYASCIAEYRYTDLSQTFLLHAQRTYGSDHPYLSYGIFDVGKPIAGQSIDAGGYDLVIAANVLHATRNIRNTLRNAKAALRTNGVLLLNEICSNSLFGHLTFGLLDGWWLYEDERVRIPGCPGLYPDGWRGVLEQEGFRSVFFPRANAHYLGQQIVVAESDGVVRQVRPVARAPGTRERLSPPASPEAPANRPVLPVTEIDEQGRLFEQVKASLLQEVSKFIKVKLGTLRPDSELSEYGFDSISFTTLARVLNDAYGLDLMPTIFFEHPTLSDLARHLVENHRAMFAARFAPSEPKPVVQARAAAPEDSVEVRPRQRRGRRFAGLSHLASTRAERAPDSDAVAVIGMSGRFPMAEDVTALWRNLVEERDCIVEIPRERWDWRAVYGDPLKEANKTNIKWGGFIDGVSEFDPLFFGISPREAELMDPQQRLMMIHIWNAIEDAGYSAASLAGSQTAILVGTGTSAYARVIARSRVPLDGYSMTGMTPSVGPNRMSYFLDWHGPSEPIETACSSALVAVHRAIQALSNDSCELAVVGGVNTILTPEGHIGVDKAGMLSIDGRCKTFSRHANGYVRAEGVGMVVLKKLAAAERDGDHIYGVIRGSAENHGGRAQSLTAPNPKAQAELLKAAYRRAGIDPRTVSYIEAHGTGTELGDPIEINGLKSAFNDLVEASGGSLAGQAYCGLGSVKTNIGHLELAAGIAGLIKVLLQLKHKTLVKSLHSEELNPYIQLQDSPFYIVRQTQPWKALQDEEGRDLPRRAGVSSFGAGGVNAHVVVEEYVPRAGTVRPLIAVNHARPALVVLSAKNEERLRERAEQLVTAIEATPLRDADLANMAYTLQVGREAMESRLALSAVSMADVVTKLKGYLAGEKPVRQAAGAVGQGTGIRLAASVRRRPPAAYLAAGLSICKATVLDRRLVAARERGCSCARGCHRVRADRASAGFEDGLGRPPRGVSHAISVRAARGCRGGD